MAAHQATQDDRIDAVTHASALPADGATYRVAGLRRPVEVVVDRWGIPHLYAESVDDVFVAQGFNAARDRLFQIDLWRRRGLGRCAEVFGPAYVEQDRATRLFLYRGDMAREWAAYGPDTERLVTRFVAGINAYVHWVCEHPTALPPEFGMLGYRPAPWSPEDVVRIRSHGIAHNILHERARAATTTAAGWRADLLRQQLRPERRPHQADGVDLDLPPDVLRVYELATRPMVFAGDQRATAVGEPSLGDTRTAAGPVDGEGSNNWAVSGRLTRTGRPILASDPHRAYTTPSLRYVAHLSAPGLDVIGAGEPALPGVTAGHNGRVGFGFTIVPVDTEDLVVYELDPADPRRYRYGAGWEPFEVVQESIAVRGEASRTVELLFSRHGPVVHVDAERRRAYAVRTMWSEPGTAPYLGSLAYLGARDAAEFRAALDRWGSPGENHVYADVSGTIGWKAAGFVPRRPGWDGLLPVPGDGRYEWDGRYASDELPEIVDPPDGFVATANQDIRPAGFPPERQLSYEWPDPARHQRIVEVLSAGGAHSVEASMRLQTDVRSVAAREVLGLLAGLRPDDEHTEAALALLRDWDADESVDSAAAALYELWWSRHLAPGLVQAVAPEAAGVVVTYDRQEVRDALRDPTRWFGDGSAADRRDTLLRATLRAAYREATKLLGDDPRGWRWGDLHVNWQRHPLGFLDPSLDVGPIPVGGSATTVAAAPYLAHDFIQTVGASFRMVLDVGAWDNSVVVNTPGQSGDPRSPHYRDLVDRWQRGEYVPLLYTRAAVEQNAAARYRLEPADVTGG